MFRFTLQPVAEQRRHIEEARQRDLAVLAQQDESLKQRRESLAQAAEARGAEVRRRQGTMSLTHRALYESWISAQHADAARVEAERQKLSQRLVDARKRLVEAMQQRQIMDELETRERRAWTQEENRRERQVFDEIALREFNEQRRAAKNAADPERMS